MTREDAKFLCWYHLWNREVFGPEQAKKIANVQDTLYLFATNKPKQKFDMDSLLLINSVDNPIALVRPKYKETSRRGKETALHFKNDSQVPLILRICRGAKVEIAGRNYLPASVCITVPWERSLKLPINLVRVLRPVICHVTSLFSCTPTRGNHA
jgi:hypothetical protein